MPSFFVLNVRDCENLVVPEKIKEVGIFENDIYTFSNLI
jgi:hypothetical protein